ncbi:MAG: toll/interleukin-1 receptor domain-containing protein [Proteobacteria bacterium]|nr:toll/interleukin-1 receptor domain-containing protein [Pseudomonadota bacterium]
MPGAQIFISYRREDTAGYARAVYDELTARFGSERVFIDVDDIAAGQPFAEIIQRTVGASKVLLVLIGRRWLGERDDALPRIADPEDFVRIEVATGLASGMRVIPVLLDGAAMPAKWQLPEPLQPLAERNALVVDHSGFAADIERLIAALQEVLGVSARGRRRRVATAAWILAGLLAAGGFGVAWWKTLSGGRAGVTSAAVAAAPAASDIVGTWQADVTYDWPNARHAERFVFAGDTTALHGSASFLGVPRGILEAGFEPGGLHFVTRTGELGGSDTVHRYRARWSAGAADELRFVMQTEGGSSEHLPVEFVARRAEAAAPR